MKLDTLQWYRGKRLKGSVESAYSSPPLVEDYLVAAVIRAKEMPGSSVSVLRMTAILTAAVEYEPAPIDKDAHIRDLGFE